MLAALTEISPPPSCGPPSLRCLGETKQVLEVVKEMFEALNAKIDGLGTEMKTRMAKIETTIENDAGFRNQSALKYLVIENEHRHVNTQI